MDNRVQASLSTEEHGRAGGSVIEWQGANDLTLLEDDSAVVRHERQLSTEILGYFPGRRRSAPGDERDADPLRADRIHGRRGPPA